MNRASASLTASPVRRLAQQVALPASVAPQAEHHEVPGIVVLGKGHAGRADRRDDLAGGDHLAGGGSGRNHTGSRPCGTAAGVHTTDGSEPELGRGSHQRERPFLVVHTGQRDHHAVRGPGDLGFGHAQAVHPVTDDLDRLVQHLLVGRAYGRQPDRYAALQVQAQQRFVSPDDRHHRSGDGDDDDPDQEYELATWHGRTG